MLKMNPPLPQQATLIKRNLAPIKREKLEESIELLHRSLKG